ncbi:MAG: IS66 family insertion sequence element accessory protein TnpB [Gammaproteobacteria bacterium]
MFLNKRSNRIKVLVHDGFGLWLAARRLHQGRFVPARIWQRHPLELSTDQLQVAGGGVALASGRHRKRHFSTVTATGLLA